MKRKWITVILHRVSYTRSKTWDTHCVKPKIFHDFARPVRCLASQEFSFWKLCFHHRTSCVVYGFMITVTPYDRSPCLNNTKKCTRNKSWLSMVFFFFFFPMVFLLLILLKLHLFLKIFSYLPRQVAKKFAKKIIPVSFWLSLFLLQKSQFINTNQDSAKRKASKNLIQWRNWQHLPRRPNLWKVPIAWTSDSCS